VSGGNGVYQYGSGGFPANSFASSNYWVDVSFVPYLDPTPPVITAVQAGSVTCGTVTITWTTDRPSDSQVEYGTTTSYGTFTPVDAALVTSHSVTISGLTMGTLYHFRVKSRSNPIAQATSPDFTFTTTIETVPPNISNVQVLAHADTSVYISWTTNKLSDTQVEYGPTPAYGSLSTLNPAAVTSHSIMLTGLTPGTLYYYRVRSRDVCGNLGVSSGLTLRTGNVPANTIWSSSATPAVPANSDASPIEVGVKFRSDVNGYVTGVRFYKGTGNTGTHVGKLWTATGTLLANAVFANETAAGWQQVNFSEPVAITANTVYVVSYYAPVGRYSLNQMYFSTSGVDNGPLHALRDGISGGNGVYLYGAGGFPTQTFGSSNYWVDVVFVPYADPTPPVITAVQSGSIACGSVTITWTTDKPTDSQVEYGTTTSYGLASPLNATLVTSHSVTLIGLTPGTLYHFRVKSKSSPINEAASTDLTFTTTTDLVPPSLTGIQAVANSDTSVYIAWTSGKLADTQVEYGPTTAYGSSSTLNPAMVTSHSVLLTGLTPGALYHYRVKSRDMCGNLGISADLTFRTSSLPSRSIWSSTTVPAVLANNDAASIEVGVKFRASVNGHITGIRFYKGAGNTGTHKGNLWTATGTLLSTATFTNETASGWQQVNFTEPVAITANAVYVASYHAPVGRYSVDYSYFAPAGVDNGPLRALRDGESGANGVYLYGPGGFPTQTYASSNYWVDVVFVPYSDPVPPLISAVQSGSVTCGSVVITWTTDKPSDSLVEYGTTTAYGSSSPLNPALVTSHSVTLMALTPNTLYHFRVKSKSSGINEAPSTDLTFTTTLDLVPPTFQNVQATAVTDSTAYIMWATNKLADTQVEYGPTASYGTTSPLDTALTTGHSVLLTGLTPNTLYHYRLQSRDLCGNLGISGDFTFTTGTVPARSIWPATATPGVASNGDTLAVEVGVKFRSDVAGHITGIRFYKGAANTGIHTGRLWTVAGTLLSSAVFTNETASGWQQVNFAEPVAIAANTVYVASYSAPVGRYAIDQAYFSAAGFDNVPLHALRDGVSGANGVYVYGAGSFPTQTFASSNYWVDVLFVPQPAP
jgi:phosphodiesterase/alkaline phosphatase D-like protein